MNVSGVARLDLTVPGAATIDEAHEAALAYIRKFEGDPWAECTLSRWDGLGLGLYLVRFEARAEALPRGEAQDVA